MESVTVNFDFEDHAPRPEHPLPSMARDSWMSLHGQQDYAIAPQNAEMQKGGAWNRHMLVPFVLRSVASGVGIQNQHIDTVWNRFQPSNVEEHLRNGSTRAILRARGSVVTTPYINGVAFPAGRGGYRLHNWDVTQALRKYRGSGPEIITRVDNKLSQNYPRGKQTLHEMVLDENGVLVPAPEEACKYDSATGLDGVIGLEFVGSTFVKGLRMTPNIQNGALGVEASLNGDTEGLKVLIKVYDGDREIGIREIGARSLTKSQVTLTDFQKWSPDNPNMTRYEVILHKNGKIIDAISGQTGMREITNDNGIIKLNGERLYMRGILDQGYNSLSLYTAPSREFVQAVFQMYKDMGLNTVRLHQVSDPLYAQVADKMGLLIMADLPPNWGFDHSTRSRKDIAMFRDTTMSILNEGYNHPSIIAWSMFNEVDRRRNGCERNYKFMRDVINCVLRTDPTRLVSHVDGFSHPTLEEHPELLQHLNQIIYGVHTYKDALIQKQEYDKYKDLKAWGRDPSNIGVHPAMAVMFTEIGGAAYDNDCGWGYRRCADAEAYERHIRATIQAIDTINGGNGWIWTQGLDTHHHGAFMMVNSVEVQKAEVNGVIKPMVVPLGDHRWALELTPKLPMALLRSIFSGNSGDVVGTRRAA